MKNVLLTLLLSFYCNFFFSQLELSNVSYTFKKDSISDSTGLTKKLVVTIELNDVELLGQLLIDLVDPVNEVPMVRFKSDLIELQNSNSVNGNTISIYIGEFDSRLNYNLKVLARNFQMLDLPQVVKSITSN